MRYPCRFQPADATEPHWCEALVRAAWCQKRLWALEVAVIDRFLAALRGEIAEDAPALPSLDTVIRYRARLDRDYYRALKELAAIPLT